MIRDGLFREGGWQFWGPRVHDVRCGVTKHNVEAVEKRDFRSFVPKHLDHRRQGAAGDRWHRLGVRGGAVE